MTGGSSGMGLATAERFVAEGAEVIIKGRRQAELDRAVEQIGSGVIAFQGDVGKVDDLDRLFAMVKEKKGRLDVLFANAGGGEFMPLGQIAEENFDQTFNSNVKGVLFTVQKALPLLVNGASIILNASIAGSKRIPAFRVYNASKAAVRSFARTWTVDLKERGIRVNALSPGPVATPGWLALAKSDEEREQMMKGVAAAVPVGRVGTADEIARAAVFLASDDSSYVTGTELFLDGEWRRCRRWVRGWVICEALVVRSAFRGVICSRTP